MDTFTRILILIVIVWTLVAQVYVVAVPLSIWYIIQYEGYELIVAAILVDGYYRAFFSFPKLTLIVLISVIFINFVKPKLLMYTE